MCKQINSDVQKLLPFFLSNTKLESEEFWVPHITSSTV